MGNTRKSKSKGDKGGAMLHSILLYVALLPVMALDILLYVLSFQWWTKLLPVKKSLQSVRAGEATQSHGAPRRSALYPNELVGGEHDTIYDMTQAAVREYGDKIAMVSQKFIELRKANESDHFPTKVFDDKELRETTFAQFGRNLQNFGAGLRKLGMEPIPIKQEGKTFDDLEGPFVMVIFEDTCEQWTTALQGAFSQSITVATC